MKQKTHNIKAFALGALCAGLLVTQTAGATSLSEYRTAKGIESPEETAVSAAAEESIAHTEQLQAELDRLAAKLAALKEGTETADADTLRALSERLANVEQELRDQANLQIELIDRIDRAHMTGTAFTQGAPGRPLVNPAPAANSAVSYTQDAANAQGNSTMTFSYAPDQLYKIYCRTGYLTDIELKKGEMISFVGGGDTSSWAVNTTTVGGTPHIYVKPVVQSNTTNLIITTNKRSYQLILTTSDWYNPMVRWSYELEEAQTAMMQRERDEQTITASMSVTSVDKLYFDYKITVKGSNAYKPEMVFDDGEKTIIRMAKGVKQLPALFIREPGKKDLSLANFKTKDNTYILDRVIDRAELRYGEHDIVKIERRK